MATHSSIIAWEIPRTEEPEGLQSIVSQRVDHDLVTKENQQIYIFRFVKFILRQLIFSHPNFIFSLPDPNLPCKVKWALGSITMNKASGGDGIPVELFQILKDDAVKGLHSICQQIWKTWQWSQEWKSSVFIPIPKKDNAKECSNYCTIVFISHVSKVMLKILQVRLQ